MPMPERAKTALGRKHDDRRKLLDERMIKSEECAKGKETEERKGRVSVLLRNKRCQETSE